MSSFLNTPPPLSNRRIPDRVLPRLIILPLFPPSSAGVTFQFQCSSESTNGTGVQGGQIPELIFYGPSISGSNTNTLKRSRSPENCQGVVVTKET